MNWPEGIQARPIDKGDVEAWAVLMAAKEKADQDGENYSTEDLLEELDHPGLDLVNDSIGLWAGDRMVGYGIAHVKTSVVDVDRIRTEGTVDPEWRRRGLGTLLMQWLIRRAGELHAANHPQVSGLVGADSNSDNVGAVSMLEKLGFKPERFFFDMQRLLDQPVPDSPVADGLRLTSYDPAYEEALRLAHFEAFSDHWGWTPPTPEQWRAGSVGSRAFRAQQSFLVLDGETVAAYVNGYEWESDTEATGVRELYIGQVGTRRAYRGRGLARATIAKVLTEAAAAGYDRAGLGVDAENPTGALGLYENLGFTTHNRFTSYALPITS